LSTTYRTIQGDTFSSVAVKTTGLDTTAASIQSSNPGAREPFRVGTTLQIPDIIEIDATFESSGLDIEINNTKIGTFNNYTLSKSIQAIRRVRFEIPNEESTREIIEQFANNPVIIGNNGKLSFTGFCIVAKPDGKILTIDCYSKCSVLENSPPPMTSFPMEFKDSTIGGIVKYLSNVMGTDFSFAHDVGARFDKTDIQPSDAVLAYFAKLAKQRNFIISDDVHGSLVFWRGVGLGEDILRIDDSTRPDVTVSVDFNESEYYSSITGILKTKTDKIGATYTVENPFFNGIIKPYNFEIDESSDGELKTVVDVTAGRMFARALTISVTIASWLDDNGNDINMNEFISLKSPDNYIRDFSKFLIKDVNQSLSNNVKSSTLELVLPGAFSGELPEVAVWK